MKIQKKLLGWMQNSLDEYSSQMSISKHPKTCEAYCGDIKGFLEYLTENALAPTLKRLKSSHIVGYLAHSLASGRAPSTVNRRYMSIDSFLKHLRRTKQLEKDLTEDIVPPRSTRKLPIVPDKAQMELLLLQPNVTTESGVRDIAMLSLLYSSGLRASELCDLKLSNFTPTSIQVTGKRGKTRTVPITMQACIHISNYLNIYRGREEGWLFQTLYGKRMQRQVLYGFVKIYAKKAGLDGITTHTLRHACATHLLQNGADLRLIQEVLGHDAISSTQIYTHLSSATMQEMFHKFHPQA